VPVQSVSAASIAGLGPSPVRRMLAVRGSRLVGSVEPVVSFRLRESPRQSAEDARSPQAGVSGQGTQQCRCIGQWLVLVGREAKPMPGYADRNRVTDNRLLVGQDGAWRSE
jgi:hypothetical protein